MILGDTTRKRKLISFFGIYFQIHLKTNQRKIIFSIINSILIYLIIISTFSIWSMNKEYDFRAYFTSKDTSWKEDGVFSAYFSTEQLHLVDGFTLDYLETTTIEIQNELSKEIPNIKFTQTTGLMSVEFFHDNGSSYNSYGLSSLNNEASFVLKNSLIAGRLPENSSEILYYFERESIPNYNISDIITLRTTPVFEATKKNLTVVGIISNLDTNLTKENYSVDILDWQENIARTSAKFTPNENFFSLPDPFFNLLNSFDSSSVGAVLIDFQYNLSLVDSRKINSYISNSETLAEGIALETGEMFYVGLDIFQELVSYKTHWIQETFFVVILHIPILFLLCFFFFEIFHSFKSSIQVNYRQVLIQGVSKKDIQKLIFMEALLVQISGLFIGILLGVVSSFLLSGIFFGVYNFGRVLLRVLNTLPIAMVLFVSFLLFLFILNNGLLKDIPLLKSKRMKVEKNKQTKIISLKEISFLIIGLIPLSIGILISITMPSIPPMSVNVELAAYSSYVWYWLLSQSFIYLGGTILAIEFLLITSKIFMKLYFRIGRVLWGKWKNRTTLSLQSISFNKELFKKFFFTLVIIGFGILPGFIIKPSITNHIDFEANLASGGSDLIIYDWVQDEVLQQSIESIDDVVNSTVVTLYEIESHIYNAKKELIILNFHILSIYDPSSFITIVDFGKFSDANYGSEEINQLNSNLTYLVDKNYASTNKLSRGAILSNQQLCRVKDVFQLKYITSFTYFPLVPHFDLASKTTKPDALFVMNSDTTNTFLTNAENLTIVSQSYLLIDLDDSADSLSIRENLENEYDLTVKNYEIITEELMTNINEFVLDVFVIWSVIISCYLIIYVVLKAGVIFKERETILENEYRLGKSKLNMSVDFVVEILYFSILPILLTITLNATTLRLVCVNLLNTPQLYKIFRLNLPFWLLISLFVFLVGIVISGWSIGTVWQVKNFRMIKQE